MSLPKTDTQWPFYRRALAVGDIQIAHDIARNAAQYYEEREDFRQAGMWLHELAWCFHCQGRYEDAVAMAERAVEIQPDPYQQALALVRTASSYTFSCKYDFSFNTYGKAEEIIRTYQRDAFLKAFFCGDRAVLFMIMGDIDQAIADADESIPLMLNCGLPHYAAMNVNNAGYWLSLRGRHEEAEQRLLTAMKLLDKKPHRFAEANTYDSLGQLYTMMGRYADAERLLRKSAGLFEMHSNKAELASTLLNLSRLHERMRLYKESHENATRALKLATDERLSHLWLDAKRRLSEIEPLLSRGSVKSCSLHGMIYVSSAMEDVIARLRNIAVTDEVVLLLGETGTGKELAARAIHLESRRRKAPFVPFNCFALSRDLIESRLFGHRKGAFTGADQNHKGVIRAAEGGTLFLDEIGDLSLEAQGALLRFLQSGEIQPVGANRPVNVNVRVIAATNRDLAKECKAGRFREDLYHRLDVVTLWMPPLRIRRDDIWALARHFAALYSQRYAMPEPLLTHAEISRLADYGWPGNVRELESHIKRRILGLEPIRESESNGHPLDVSWRKLSEEEKQQRLIEALEKHGGNITRAAAQLGLSRRAAQKIRQRMKQDQA